MHKYQMLLREFTITEAKYREPILVYHGTSDIVLPSLLKDGVQPFPKNRTWETDDNTSAQMLSRKSMGGSYWTSDWMTAYGSAGRAIDKLGGTDRVIVCAKINEQSAYADEDNMNGRIRNALGAVLSNIGISASLDYLVYLLPYFFKKSSKQNELTDIFRTSLSKYLKEEYILPRDKAKTVIKAFIIRALAYSDRHYQLRHLEYSKIDPEKFPIPTKEEAEHDCWIIRQQLTKTFKRTAYRGDDAWHTLRTELSIGFRGNNKIICIASIHQNPETRKTEYIKVHYGEIPYNFVRSYEISIGEWPEVISKTQ